MDYIAIDFETANKLHSSTCSLGIVVVSNGEISEKRNYLIKPEPFKFDDINIQIHGITPDMVKDAPTFKELWSELLPLMENKIVVAHNASFDISVLRRTLEAYKIPSPKLKFICTYKLAQAAYPKLATFRLNILSNYLGIELEHHNALSDALACSEILRSIMEPDGLNSLEDLTDRYSLEPGIIDYYDFGDMIYRPCRVKSVLPCATNKKLKPSEMCAEYIDDDFDGKGVCFTGTLMTMTREQALTVVAKGGGIPCNSVTKKTNYLVMGIQDLSKLNGYPQSSKTRKAELLRSQGQDIKIIDEQEFLSLIDDELYKICFE